MTQLIAKYGGYKNLKSFQMAEIVYDLNYEFCKRYIPSLKQREQMEGAARGGKQNIAEGSETSGTSKSSELRLVQVASASQGELLKDYEDFLRTWQLLAWTKDDVRAKEIRNLAYRPERSCKTYMTYMSDPEIAANCMVCLINQTKYLLDQQLRSLEKDLIEKGDYKDRLKQIKKEKILPGQTTKEEDDEFFKSIGYHRLENGLLARIGSNIPLHLENDN